MRVPTCVFVCMGVCVCVALQSTICCHNYAATTVGRSVGIREWRVWSLAPRPEVLKSSVGWSVEKRCSAAPSRQRRERR
uniref:Putative secreted protein n=1 Tax=Anopheles marajoara TaxID=58244 RepID=A0A2M4CBZ9_9DIPT